MNISDRKLPKSYRDFYLSTMIKLENEHLEVMISSKGAEIQSLINKKTGIEHLWQADPAFWPNHAPNLFPVVGSCKNDQILVDEEAYPMGRHGFARHTLFTMVDSTPCHAVFSICDTAETHVHYPYKFEFQVIYDLIHSRLRISFKVINKQESDIFFSLGAHPAFKVPFFEDEKYEDYYVQFTDPAPLRVYSLSKNGLFNGESRPAPLIDRKLHLNHELFVNDALVMKEVKSRKVSIASSKNPHIIEVEFQEFPFLGVWAKPGAKFVCIEPWLGYADQEGPEKEFTEKEAIHKLGQGHVFEASYYIGFGER